MKNDYNDKLLSRLDKIREESVNLMSKSIETSQNELPKGQK